MPITTMTQMILKIRSKRVLPFLKRLSKSMGWAVSGQDTPNAETIETMRAESASELEDFDLEGLHKLVAGSDM